MLTKKEGGGGGRSDPTTSCNSTGLSKRKRKKGRKGEGSTEKRSDPRDQEYEEKGKGRKWVMKKPSWENQQGEGKGRRGTWGESPGKNKRGRKERVENTIKIKRKEGEALLTEAKGGGIVGGEKKNHAQSTFK